MRLPPLFLAPRLLSEGVGLQLRGVAEEGGEAGEAPPGQASPPEGVPRAGGGRGDRARRATS